jgi:hypothetical protein
MIHGRPRAQRTPEFNCGSLLLRLQQRQKEIEETILTRIYAVSDPRVSGDPEYVAGLREAVAEAVMHGFSAVRGFDGPVPVPPSRLLAQAARAARSGVSLDTVLRRYLAGYTLLSEFIMQEAKEDPLLFPEAIARLASSQAGLFDRLIVAVSCAYSEELEGEQQSVDHVQAERIRRLLAGELLDAPELGYELDGWHLAAVATGPGATGLLRQLAPMLDRRLLLVCCGDSVWAWFGGRREVEIERMLDLATAAANAEVALAVGEQARGLAGWRLTHQQAMAALPIAIRGPQRLVRYADVALLSTALRDGILSRSLRDIYLAPLEEERDGGAALRETLVAYFAASRNASSAAAALGVSRNTVGVRLRVIEERIGRTVDGCAAELEMALRLLDLTPR